MPTRFLLICFLVIAGRTLAQAPLGVTTPEQAFGQPLCSDYFLVNYQQMTDYWHTLEKESSRFSLESIGKTEEGRDMLMAVVTSPENMKRVDHFREISRRLALAEGVDEALARRLAAEGKCVVWIDGGLHATEVLVAQQLIETSYQLVSRNDPETLRMLDDLVILLCCPNPDGLDLVADWYMRRKEPEKRSLRGLPRLYQKYIGHDNNRDFYMVSQKETQAICGVFYKRWFPQIVYNHHQTGPSGTVLFAPPFRDPFNYNFDPLVPLGIELVGTAMHSRFVQEGKGGSTMRKGASYSTWWNGGLRTNVYFHNMIGLLTETTGSPNPMKIPLRLDRQLPSSNLPMPIPPQQWHFRQSLDYALTANWAVFDVASRYRETFLFNAWRMGMNSIQRGSRDHWTTQPNMIRRARKDLADRRNAARSMGKNSAKGTNAPAPEELTWQGVFRDPAMRDPRGYVIPSNQRDFPTATKFVNALIRNGIRVHRATKAFAIRGKEYPEDSYVVYTAQAFRPHILDMFEPQVHPDDIPYPGGPPTPPYDAAGWTLAYQMGVTFDRVLEPFDGPFQTIEGLAKPPAGEFKNGFRAAGYLFSDATNDSHAAANQLLADRARVFRLTAPLSFGEMSFPPGTFYVEAGDVGTPILQDLAKTLGIDVLGVHQKPTIGMRPLKRIRVGLWDRYGGSMASGWIRWLLEQFGFEFQLVFAPELDAGGLAERFDVLIFPSGAVPDSDARRRRRGGRDNLREPDDLPEEYRGRWGHVSVQKTVPRLKEFLEQGGRIVCLGGSTSLARHLDLPIEDALTLREQDGKVRPLKRDEFFIPGSILRMHVDTSQPLARGLTHNLDVMFRRSPVFRLGPAAAGQGIRPVAWFDTVKPLRSGWAWGQERLENTIGIVDAPVGKGHLFLFGPDITYRAQPHASFKFLFNALH